MANYVPSENLSLKRKGSRHTMEFRTDQKRPPSISEEEMAMKWDRIFGKKSPALQLVPDETPGEDVPVHMITELKDAPAEKTTTFYSNEPTPPVLSANADRVLGEMYDTVVVNEASGENLAGCEELGRKGFATCEGKTWIITALGVREYRRREINKHLAKTPDYHA